MIYNGVCSCKAAIYTFNSFISLELTEWFKRLALFGHRVRGKKRNSNHFINHAKWDITFRYHFNIFVHSNSPRCTLFLT